MSHGENETSFIRVWKPSLSRCILKPWGPERESLKRIISANGGLGSLQMVWELDTGRCVRALKGVDLVGSTLIGERNECQWGHWAPKGVDCDVPYWFGKNETPFIRVWKLSPSKRVLKPWGEVQKSPQGKANVVPRRGLTRGGVSGPKGGGLGGVHIDWRKEWVSVRTLGSEGGELWCPTLVGCGNIPLANTF